MNFSLDAEVRTVIVQCTSLLVDAGIARDAGITDAFQARAVCEHEVKLLLTEACGIGMNKLDTSILMRDRVGTITDEESLVRFGLWLERRLAREPLQHITGHAPFRYLDLEVGPGVFVPRPETEILIDEVISYIQHRCLQRPLIVDLCAGSGALGLAAATEINSSTVKAVEISEEAIAYTRRNAERVSAKNYEVILGDAADAQTYVGLNGSVDVVISNPPYVPERDIPTQVETRDFDPEIALYGGSSDGMHIPRLIIQRANTLLKPGGLLVMEHDWQQGQQTCEAASVTGFSVTMTKKDLAGKDRYLYAIK
ncbi:peptide chain release factor N(5)-glutamine methyltransferase [Alloscardovia venturai]|uniref:Peptide chain release factor N(5)-glutamine methyltransferase n=1 Tax=Alloscardovia venturai TaxID=1769421 RepID=A0ABW2Y346_9BIFI